MERLVPQLLATSLALPLAIYASVGSFARYTADDFCWAGVLRTEGFLRAQMLWYTGYSPRYAFTFVVNLIELAGPGIVPVLPALAILTLVATLTWTLTRFNVRPWQALILAEVAAVATFESAPDLPQSLYWQTGMLTYLLPLVLAAFLIGWIRQATCQRRLSAWTLAVSAIVTFVAGGLSETYLIPQNVALTLALACCVLFWRVRDARRAIVAAHLTAALAGGVLALLSIVAAPSTASRVGGSPADLWLASAAAIATAWYQGVRVLRYFPFAVALCLVLPGVLGVYARAVCPRWFGLVSGCVLVTLPFCYFPSFYAQNGNPPARSLIVPAAILIGYVVFVGYMFGALIVRRWPTRHRIALASALALVPIGMAIFTLPDVSSAAEHAALWDAEDAQIRAARDGGQSDLVVPRLPSYLGENFVSTNPQDWFNVCVARYYGLRTIASTT